MLTPFVLFVASYTRAVSRLLWTLPALCLFAACGGETPEPDTKPEGASPAAPTEPVERACRVDEVHELAAVLAKATPVRRRSKVAEGLKEACDVPPSYVAFLDATQRDARREARFEAAVKAIDLLDAVCPNPEELTGALGPMKPSERPAALFDRCGLGSKELIERSMWLRSGPSSVVPFAARDWLEAQGVHRDDAIVVARALLLRDRTRWSGPDQKLPMVEGEMQTIPTNTISLELALTELRIGGARVLPLEDGKLPEKSAPGEEDPVTKKIAQALLAERETLPEDALVTLAIAVDASIPSSSIVRVAALTQDADIDSKGLVVQNADVDDGFVGISSPSRVTAGSGTLRIDAEGFHLTSPSGKTEAIPVPYDFEALDKKVFALADAQVDALPLFVEAAPGIAAGVFVNVLARLEQPGCDEAGTCRDLNVRLQDTPRSAAEAMAKSAGVLAVLSGEGGHFLASPYGGAFTEGLDDEDVWGGLLGAEGAEFGEGGLGLIGTGRGGGGTGEGTIGLGNTGLIGKGTGGPKVPRVRQAKATVKGSLDKDIIRRIVRAHIGDVRGCYNTALAKDPAVGGKVVLDFTIGSDGMVSATSISSTTLSDKEVGTCMATAAKKWKFPSPKGGGVVVVKYPFNLSPG